MAEGYTSAPTGKFTKGKYKDVNMWGRGIHKSPDGTVYEGDWKEGNMWGRGVMTLPNGVRKQTNNGV